MRISAVPLSSPDDAFRVVRTCQEFDQPDLPAQSAEEFHAALAAPWPGSDNERYLGLLDGTPVGYLVLTLPQRDNLRLARIDLRVQPEHRRHGVGRALLELAIDRARTLGCTLMSGTTVEARPDGGAFAAAMGAQAALPEVRSRLDVTTLDQDRLDALAADAWKHAAGYSAVQWVGLPPADLIDDVADLTSRFFAEAPIGDLEWEPEIIDADEIRRQVAANEQRHRELFNTALVRDGRVAGWTQAAGLSAAPDRAIQQLTLVRPEHRGHRLGLLAKLENLRLLRAERPSLHYIDTWNALSNDHMLAINRTIGFEPAEATTYWQLTL